MHTFDPLLAVASGSAGDLVASHNQYGPYTRRRVTPIDPATRLQDARRRHLANVSWRWINILTAAQRRAWRTYAANMTYVNRVGGPYRVHAQASFVRCNASRLDPAIGWVNDPPTIYSQPVWTQPAVDSMGTLGFVWITIDPADKWANHDNAGMFIFVSDKFSTAINFFKGPFRLAGLIRGYSSSPPPILNWLTDPWGAIAGDRRWARSYVVHADGRVSQPAILPWTSNL